MFPIDLNKAEDQDIKRQEQMHADAMDRIVTKLEEYKQAMSKEEAAMMDGDIDEASMEGISEAVSKLWDALIKIISKLLQQMREDPYFSRMVNRNEKYRIRVIEARVGKAKDHTLADQQAFADTIVHGFTYDVFRARMTAVANIIARIKNLNPSTAGDYDLKGKLQTDLTALGFTFSGDKLHNPTYVDYRKLTASAMMWTPTKVYTFANMFLDKILIENTNLYKIRRQIQERLQKLEQLCKTNRDLGIKEDIEKSQKELTNLKQLNTVVSYTLDAATGLARQWLAMVESFKIQKKDK